MYFYIIAYLLFTCIMGAPTDNLRALGSAALDRNVVDQGDGFYLAKFDNITGVAHVDFTPMAELLKRAGLEKRTVGSPTKLNKRNGITCSGRFTNHVEDLDTANRQLASNAGSHGQYEWHDWGWVHYSTETAYFCNYQRNYLSYDMIIGFNVDISDACYGSKYYGFERKTNTGTIQDLAVGRTFRDDNFCDGDNHER